MAKVRDNHVTEGLSGKLGKRLYFRRGKGGKTILATRPVYPEDREPTENQAAQHTAFKRAIAYAKGAKDQPLYVKLAKGTDATPYNLAVADWFGQPEVLEIDASAWTGQSGQPIFIQAIDDTRVTNVTVVIHNNGTIFEQGEAVPANGDGLTWIYTTTTNVPTSPAPVLDANAYDLARNFGSSSIQLNVN